MNEQTCSTWQTFPNSYPRAKMAYSQNTQKSTNLWSALVAYNPQRNKKKLQEVLIPSSCTDQVIWCTLPVRNQTISPAPETRRLWRHKIDRCDRCVNEMYTAERARETPQVSGNWEKFNSAVIRYYATSWRHGGLCWTGRILDASEYTASCTGDQALCSKLRLAAGLVDERRKFHFVGWWTVAACTQPSTHV